MQDYVDAPYTLCDVVKTNIIEARTISEIDRGVDFLQEDLTDIDCNIDTSNTLTFKIILVMGSVFVAISALISLYIDRINRKKLLSMFNNTRTHLVSQWLDCDVIFNISLHIFQLDGYGCVLCSLYRYLLFPISM